MTLIKTCGKTILFGEHAVVYGYSGIALPIKSIGVEVEIKSARKLLLKINKPFSKENYEKLEEVIKLICKLLCISSFRFQIDINIRTPLAAGLGASASLSVALVRAISQFFNSKISQKKVNDLSFECEKVFHGNPSGIDNAVVVYQTPVYYENKNIEFFRLERPISLVIAHSGVNSSTRSVVEFVYNNYQKDPRRYEKIFQKISFLSKRARFYLENGNVDAIGALMIENHKILSSIDVSCFQLDKLVECAINKGALGAKLVGAGKGGNIVALVKEEQKDIVVSELKKLSENVFIVDIM